MTRTYYGMVMQGDMHTGQLGFRVKKNRDEVCRCGVSCHFCSLTTRPDEHAEQQQLFVLEGAVREEQCRS